MWVTRYKESKCNSKNTVFNAPHPKSSEFKSFITLSNPGSLFKKGQIYVLFRFSYFLFFIFFLVWGRNCVCLWVCNFGFVSSLLLLITIVVIIPIIMCPVLGGEIVKENLIYYLPKTQIDYLAEKEFETHSLNAWCMSPVIWSALS